MAARLAFPLLAAALALPATAVLAQDAPGEECTGLESEAAEIACLRALLEESRSEAPARQPAPPAPASEPAAAPASVAAPEMGQEQLAAKEDQSGTDKDRDADRERLVAAIVDTRRDRRGRLVMQLDNGQIWRQIEAIGVPVRFDEQSRTPIEISRSGFGGYRMHFTGQERRIAVARLR